MLLEYCCDASQMTYPPDNRVFTCSGVICINDNRDMLQIMPDSTNNRGELIGLYLACKMALMDRNYLLSQGIPVEGINIYCDSQFVVYGLTRWLPAWVASLEKWGEMIGSSGKPVANQNMFMMILTFCSTNDLHINLYNQMGHVKLGNKASMAKANKQFFQANGYYLPIAKLEEISLFNNMIDKKTRDILREIDPNLYPVTYYNNSTGVQMCHYKLAENYADYIKGK